MQLAHVLENDRRRVFIVGEGVVGVPEVKGEPRQPPRAQGGGRLEARA